MAIERVLNNTIVSNYNIICKKANCIETKPNVVPLWSLKYENDKIRGFVSQDGTIECNGSQIQILGDTIKKIKKPFFSTWKGALQDIDKMLENLKENYETSFVKKRVVNMVTFSKEQISQLIKSCEEFINSSKL